MHGPQNSFVILPDLAARMPQINPRWVWAWRVLYWFKALWRHLRITRIMTRLAGPQYVRSRDLIEIDITYLCNLHCLNCNRSVSQAREDMHMPIGMVSAFVDETIAKAKRWRRIRVLGGEPTLHPQFHQVIAELRRYRAWHPECIVEVVSNGYGPHVSRLLGELPADIMIDNTAKSSRVQPHFGPFNLAPADDIVYALTDYSNACAIARDCGMGLTPMGYYPCAVAGGIDRILGANLGAQSLPADDDDMLEMAQRFCRLCGRFRDGHFVPRVLRPVLDTERVSPTWKALYERWHVAKERGEQAVPITVGGKRLGHLAEERRR